MAQPLVVVMGVSGAGKSTVARRVADALGTPFVDGDDLHPAANVSKMASGIPLTDDDRAPWLDAVGRTLAEADATGMVVACSALKRAYRDRIRAAAPSTWFAELDGTVELLTERVAGRPGHFMPPSLLASQLATLEPVGDGEAGVRFDIAEGTDELAAAIAARVEAEFR